MPAGTSTSRLRSSRTRPAPLQVSHGCSTTRPVPPQRAHAWLRMNSPKAVRETCWMRPVPPQSSQVDAVVPGWTPSPPHSAHGIATCTGTARVIPRRGLLERDLDLGRDVGSASPARAGRDAEDVVSEERREDVGQAPEVERRRPKASAAEAGVAEPVVELAGLGLREHLVRLDDFPEPRVRVRLGRDVRVQLAREPPEGPLDLGLGGRARDAEDLVVVATRRRHLASRG